MTPFLTVCIGGGIVLLWIVAGVAYFFVSRRQSSVGTRLGQFTTAIQDVAPAASVKETKAKKVTLPLSEQLSQIFAGRKFAEGMMRDLARADVKLNVVEYLVAHGVVAVITAALAWWFVGRGLPSVIPLVVALAGGVGGLFLPRMYVGSLQAKRLATFDNQLGDMLNLVVNGLRAGVSVMQALESVGKELPPPISTEFRRVVQEMQLGLPMEQALSNLVRRIPSKDLDFVVTAINVQREVGGNLAEILDTITYTIRERVRIKGEIEVLVAQGMYTGYIISLLPLLLAAFLFLINRSYMMLPFEPGYSGYPFCGICMVGAALGLIGSGFFAVMKIVKIEV
jgi:tight adherence protein B